MVTIENTIIINRMRPKALQYSTVLNLGTRLILVSNGITAHIVCTPPFPSDRIMNNVSILIIHRKVT